MSSTALSEVDELSDIFKGVVSVLVVDDTVDICAYINEMAGSDVMHVHSAFTLAEAERLLYSRRKVFHCMLLDLKFGNVFSGIDLLDKQFNIPYIIAITGENDVEEVAKAMSHGAITVIAKGAGFIEKLYPEVCMDAALGYLLGAVADTEFKKIFNHLREQWIEDVAGWASAVHISPRQLETICNRCVGLPPGLTLRLFHALSCIFMKAGSYWEMAKELPKVAEHIEYCELCVKRVVEKFEEDYGEWWRMRSR